MPKLLLASILFLLLATLARAADQQTIDYQKQYEEYQRQLKVYNEQMEDYKRKLREHQEAPMDNDSTYVLPGQYTAGRKIVTQQPQQYTPNQQYYQQYDYYDQRQRPAQSQPSNALPNYYY